MDLDPIGRKRRGFIGENFNSLRKKPKISFILIFHSIGVKIFKTIALLFGSMPSETQWNFFCIFYRHRRRVWKRHLNPPIVSNINFIFGLFSARFFRNQEEVFYDNLLWIMQKEKSFGHKKFFLFISSIDHMLLSTRAMADGLWCKQEIK